MQIKQRKHQSNVWNLFKLNNKDARIHFEIPNEFSVLESWLGIFAKFRIENQLTDFYSGFCIAFYDWHLMGWAAFSRFWDLAANICLNRQKYDEV